MAVDRKSGEVAGFLNGLATDGDCLKDEFFRNADLHDPTGDNVMILGLAVLPKYRGIGVASELMRRYSGIQRQQGRCALILTCLDAKVEMYKRWALKMKGYRIHLGAENNGIKCGRDYKINELKW